MQSGQTALMYAAEQGHIDIVQYLIKETTAQLNATNDVSNVNRVLPRVNNDKIVWNAI